MSQKLVQLGLGGNIDNKFYLLSGTDAPGASGGYPDTAPIGSLYVNSTEGSIWRKYSSGTGIARWQQIISAFAPNTVSSVTTGSILDSDYVDKYSFMKWVIEAISVSNPADKYVCEVMAIHNGTPSADATEVTHNISSAISINAHSTLGKVTPSVRLTGSGAEQKVELLLTCTTSVDVSASRIINGQLAYSPYGGVISGGSF